MNVQRALTKKEKIIVLVFILAVIVITGLTRPLWSSSAAESGSAATAESAAGGISVEETQTIGSK
jgi:hypothetical protein